LPHTDLNWQLFQIEMILDLDTALDAFTVLGCQIDLQALDNSVQNHQTWSLHRSAIGHCTAAPSEANCYELEIEYASSPAVRSILVVNGTTPSWTNALSWALIWTNL
jgi:hypothetical protein